MYGGHLFAQPSTSYCREPFPALPSSPKNKRIRGPLRDPQPRPGPVLAPNANLEPFWEYLRDVIFRKLEDPYDNKAHISSIIQAMKGDQALLYGYGDILEYVLNKISMIYFRYIDFHEFRSMVSAPQASAQLSKPSPARLTARQESGENEGGVVTRIMHQKTQEYLQRLAKISDDYKVPDSDLQKVADQEASALDTFGTPGDALKQAIDQCSALVEERAQERREKGVEDSRDLVDRVHKRMTGGDVDDLIRKRMAPLTPAQEAEVREIFKGSNLQAVLVNKYNVDMTRDKLRSLREGVWLNDEVINFYFNLLLTRDEQLREKDPNRRGCHFFNSFFITKLLDEKGYCYANVRRWTRRIDLFELDKIFFPVNLHNTHWCLAVVYMQQKKIQYYDSMNGAGTKYLQGLKKYLEEEYKDKKGGATLDMSDWKLVPTQPNTPQQDNSCDCGVFATCFAYLLAENLPVNKVNQGDMFAFRKRMALSIVNGKLDI